MALIFLGAQTSDATVTESMILGEADIVDGWSDWYGSDDGSKQTLDCGSGNLAEEVKIDATNGAPTFYHSRIHGLELVCKNGDSPASSTMDKDARFDDRCSSDGHISGFYGAEKDGTVTGFGILCWDNSKQNVVETDFPSLIENWPSGSWFWNVWSGVCDKSKEVSAIRVSEADDGTIRGFSFRCD